MKVIYCSTYDFSSLAYTYFLYPIFLVSLPMGLAEDMALGRAE